MDLIVVQRYDDNRLVPRIYAHSSSTCCDGGRGFATEEENGLKSVAKVYKNPSSEMSLTRDLIVCS